MSTNGCQVRIRGVTIRSRTVCVTTSADQGPA